MQTRHFLLIDDEDDIREVAGLSLEMTQGWTITAAIRHAAGMAGTCATKDRSSAARYGHAEGNG